MNELTENQRDKSVAAIGRYVGKITKRHRRNCSDAAMAGMHMIVIQNDNFFSPPPVRPPALSTAFTPKANF